MSLWNECFGDLDFETQKRLKIVINKINRLVGLEEEG